MSLSCLIILYYFRKIRLHIFFVYGIPELWLNTLYLRNLPKNMKLIKIGIAVPKELGVDAVCTMDWTKF